MHEHKRRQKLTHFHRISLTIASACVFLLLFKGTHKILFFCLTPCLALVKLQGSQIAVLALTAASSVTSVLAAPLSFVSAKPDCLQ